MRKDLSKQRGVKAHSPCVNFFAAPPYNGEGEDNLEGGGRKLMLVFRDKQPLTSLLSWCFGYDNYEQGCRTVVVAREKGPIFLGGGGGPKMGGKRE